LALITVVLVSMGLGVLFPGPSALFTPWVLYFMMTILFLSFLRMEFRRIWEFGRRDLLEVALWAAVKLGVMPVVFWAAARCVMPDYALPVLLLSGVSTGVVAPFISTLLGADTPRVLRCVMVTSLLVPLTLPSWVKLLAGADLSIPFGHMVRMLAMVIFIPMGAVILARRTVPAFLALVDRMQFPLSLSLFFSINLGVFSRYADFLQRHVADVGVALALAFLMAILSSALGAALGALWKKRLDGLTGAVCLTFVNNVLIIVFAFRFFDAHAPLLSAMYMVPFFIMIVPLRIWARRATGSRQQTTGDGESTAGPEGPSGVGLIPLAGRGYAEPRRSPGRR
jgi:BASS family bile acid:Na+ symporter